MIPDEGVLDGKEVCNSTVACLLMAVLRSGLLLPIDMIGGKFCTLVIGVVIEPFIFMALNDDVHVLRVEPLRFGAEVITVGGSVVRDEVTGTSLNMVVPFRLVLCTV